MPIEDPLGREAKRWKKISEEILKEMPPPSIPLLPEAQASDTTKYKNRLEFGTADAWRKCAEAIEQHDADECRAHREEIDTLLVFAGLFSAVLTAFTIESYQWLQDDPNDAIIALLAQLIESSGSTQSTPAPTGLPGAVSVRINAYWFLSLTLSLSAALVAILCKQWVREFERHANQSQRQYISIRQMKLEGFQGWGVASIVMAIPLLLQSALGLFALGMIELLWKLHLTVAIVVIVPTVASLIFYALTTLLPGLELVSRLVWQCSTRSQCPFKSPQSMLALRALMRLGRVVEFARHPNSTFLRGPVDSFFHLVGLARRMEYDYPGSHTYDVEDYSRDGNPDPPYFRRRPDHLASWTALDAEFNRAMDSLDDAMQKVFSLPSLFRGLAWLRDHIDQPAIKQQICLAAWEIVIDWEQSLRIASWRLCNGIIYLMHPSNTYATLVYPSERGDVFPVSDALRYAESAGFRDDFLAELVVHHSSQISCDTMEHILDSELFPHDEETMHSLLRNLLISSTTREVPDASSIWVVGRYLRGTLSRQEVAGFVAVYLRELHSRGRSAFTDYFYFHCSQKLFRLVADYLRTSKHRDHNGPASTATDTAFSGSVLALDQSFSILATDAIVQPWVHNFAADLARDNALRDIYIGLLASALNGPVTPPGDMSAAETRFEQTVGRFVHRPCEAVRMRESLETGGISSTTLPRSPVHDALTTVAIHSNLGAPSQFGDAPQGASQESGPFQDLSTHGNR